MQLAVNGHQDRDQRAQQHGQQRYADSQDRDYLATHISHASRVASRERRRALRLLRRPAADGGVGLDRDAAHAGDHLGHHRQRAGGDDGVRRSVRRGAGGGGHVVADAEHREALPLQRPGHRLRPLGARVVRARRVRAAGEAAQRLQGLHQVVAGEGADHGNGPRRVDPPGQRAHHALHGVRAVRAVDDHLHAAPAHALQPAGPAHVRHAAQHRFMVQALAQEDLAAATATAAFSPW